MHVHDVRRFNGALYDAVLIWQWPEWRLRNCHTRSSIATRLSSLAARPADDIGRPVIERLLAGLRDRRRDRRVVAEAGGRSSDRDRLGGIGRGGCGLI